MNWKVGNKYYLVDCVYSSVYFVVFWFCFVWQGLTATQWLAWTWQRSVCLCCRTLFWLGGQKRKLITFLSFPNVAPNTGSLGRFYIRGLAPTSSFINFMYNATFLSCINKFPNLKNQNEKCSYWNFCSFFQNILKLVTIGLLYPITLANVFTNTFLTCSTICIVKKGFNFKELGQKQLFTPLQSLYSLFCFTYYLHDL